MSRKPDNDKFLIISHPNPPAPTHKTLTSLSNSINSGFASKVFYLKGESLIKKDSISLVMQ